MPPSVPHPLQPIARSRNTRTEAQRQAARAAKAETQRQEDDAVLETWKLVQGEVDKLAARFSKKADYFWERLHFQTKKGGPRTQINAYNAFIHATTNKENKDVAVGAKKSLMDIVAESGRAYDDLTAEEKKAMVEELRAHKESQERGLRVTAKARAADVRQTLGEVEKKLTSLQKRSGVRSFMYNVRDNAAYPMKPHAYFSDVQAAQFFPDVMKVDALEVGVSFEGWSLAKMKGVNNNNRQRVLDLKEAARSFVQSGLRAITGERDKRMLYTSQYDDVIVMKHGVELRGWPLPKLKNPGDIGSIGDLETVVQALEEGRCRWERLSNAEWVERKKVLEEEVERGERKSLKWGRGSEAPAMPAGGKRKRGNAGGGQNKRRKVGKSKSKAVIGDSDGSSSELEEPPSSGSDEDT